MWPCRTLLFAAHHTHPNPKGYSKIIWVVLHLNPQVRRAQVRPQVQFALSRPCERGRCWSFIAGATWTTTRASMIWSRQGEGNFEVRVWAYICHVFVMLGLLHHQFIVLSILKCCITILVSHADTPWWHRQFLLEFVLVVFMLEVLFFFQPNMEVPPPSIGGSTWDTTNSK